MPGARVDLPAPAVVARLARSARVASARDSGRGGVGARDRSGIRRGGAGASGRGGRGARGEPPRKDQQAQGGAAQGAPVLDSSSPRVNRFRHSGMRHSRRRQSPRARATRLQPNGSPPRAPRATHRPLRDPQPHPVRGGGDGHRLGPVDDPARGRGAPGARHERRARRPVLAAASRSCSSPSARRTGCCSTCTSPGGWAPRLEQHWGAFKFNAYYFLGVLGTIVAGRAGGPPVEHVARRVALPGVRHDVPRRADPAHVHPADPGQMARHRRRLAHPLLPGGGRLGHARLDHRGPRQLPDLLRRSLVGASSASATSACARRPAARRYASEAPVFGQRVCAICGAREADGTDIRVCSCDKCGGAGTQRALCLEHARNH